MKKNKMMRIASVLLVAVLLSTCAISGTFAKYTSEGSVTTSATIATWDIQLEGNTIANNIEFSLTDTWTNTNDSGNSVTTNKIAPGTSGSGAVELVNNSEVAAEVVLGITETGVKPSNMTITYNWTDGTNSGTAVAGTPATIPVGIGKTLTITVDWVWAFTNDNETSFAGKDIGIGMAFTVSQVD